MSKLAEQEAVCAVAGTQCLPPEPNEKVGISANVRAGIMPINGLRHKPEGDTSGWYIWAGDELSSDPTFFKPLHVGHLSEWCPDAEKFLGLPPGWRFLKAGDHEDVWFDEALLMPE